MPGCHQPIAISQKAFESNQQLNIALKWNQIVEIGEEEDNETIRTAGVVDTVEEEAEGEGTAEGEAEEEEEAEEGKILIHLMMTTST